EYFSLASDMSKLLLQGKFSSSMKEEFARLLDYYGQDPFIVRSSSILEDGFGNAFAGKYDSVFCSNSGTLEERLEEFENAIRTVYASTMSLAALDYRKRRGLEHRDEQMALLIMRVSGSRYGQYFMPVAAGVGYSLSPYRFGTDKQETSGMLRLVMGLGTAAVDRMQGSYPRLVSMDNPSLTVTSSDAERHQFSQRKIDVVDTLRGGFESLDLQALEKQLPFYLKSTTLSHDYEAESYFRNMGDSRDIYYISCNGIVKNEALMEDMRSILATLQKEYAYPVDIEFTINIAKSGEYVINMLQCRPLQIAKDYEVISVPTDIPGDQFFLECQNACMGMSRMLQIDYVVMIDTLKYYQMPYNDKYQIARALGAVNWALRGQNKNLMLFAPGRICTSSPELGVPSTFAEISEFNVVCEISESGAGYMPELSYGSHIFQDLVEAGILYAALSDSNETQSFRPDMLKNYENVLSSLAPSYAELGEIIQVYHVTDERLMLYYDMPGEHLLCAFQK
ncbi:MAG: PEP/pyruvate-binding domain-containing protein, partial [Eubacteriales bacterium]|nr:PEP/pyruvate-binding domain-containing protein [Eubacteriales bacterium]